MGADEKLQAALHPTEPLTAWVLTDPAQDYDESTTVLGVYPTAIAAIAAAEAQRDEALHVGRDLEVTEWTGDVMGARWASDSHVTSAAQPVRWTTSPWVEWPADGPARPTGRRIDGATLTLMPEEDDR